MDRLSHENPPLKIHPYCKNAILRHNFKILTWFESWNKYFAFILYRSWRHFWPLIAFSIIWVTVSKPTVNVSIWVFILRLFSFSIKVRYKCVRSQAEILCFRLYRASDNLYVWSIFEYFLIFYNRPITASLRIFKHTIEKANFMAGSILCDKRFSFFMNEIERLKERS